MIMGVVGLVAVLFDYFFTLADPRPTTTTTFAQLFDRLLPGVSQHAFDTERAAFLASGAWMPRRPAYDGVPPAFQSFEDEWKHFGSLLLARFGVEAGGDAYAQARWE